MDILNELPANLQKILQAKSCSCIKLGLSNKRRLRQNRIVTLSCFTRMLSESTELLAQWVRKFLAPWLSKNSIFKLPGDWTTSLPKDSFPRSSESRRSTRAQRCKTQTSRKVCPSRPAIKRTTSYSRPTTTWTRTSPAESHSTAHRQQQVWGSEPGPLVSRIVCA